MMSTFPEFLHRKATLSDIPGLLSLINGFASRGVMLPRTELEMAENIRDFTLISEGARIIGCGALHIYTAQAAEIRSLAVDPEFQKHGAGARLMEALEVEAKSFELSVLFAFTYVPGFFQKMGYREVDRGELPLKAWKDCLRCPKFQACDEIAMLKVLREGYSAGRSRGSELVPLPVLSH